MTRTFLINFVFFLGFLYFFCIFCEKFNYDFKYFACITGLAHGLGTLLIRFHCHPTHVVASSSYWLHHRLTGRITLPWFRRCLAWGGA